ncbi:ABC transporter permease [Bacilli bacterium]|nr:ABC transporter permease [Bacilli bacterium]
MFIVNSLTYKINLSESVFENISFSIAENEKIAVVGKNGIGKSVLFKLLMGELRPSGGEIIKNGINISYFPQKFNELNFGTVADVFGLEREILSLQRVDDGKADVEDYEILDGKWDSADKIKEKMKLFNLEFSLLSDFKILSGGEKVKLILSGILDKNANFLILDEPTNNMDYESRKTFYDFIKMWHGNILLASHDRELLNLMDKIFELRKVGLKDTKLFIYGGNYDYWRHQKALEEHALENDQSNSLKIEQAKKHQAERTLERFKRGYAKTGRLDQYGNLKAARTLQEMHRETSPLQQIVNSKERIRESDKNIETIQSKMEIKKNVYFKFEKNKFTNKTLIDIENMHFSWDTRQIFNNFSMIVRTGDRIAIEGKNGSGKTTLFKIIMGKINSFTGHIKINTRNIAHLDQNCDCLDNNLNILENMKLHNNELSEGGCRDILAKFLFRTDAVYKKIYDLSGGERLRVALACILGRNSTPELLLLDEPTNNMDLDSVEILENILKSYNGTIMVISHDDTFKKNINLNAKYEI